MNVFSFGRLFQKWVIHLIIACLFPEKKNEMEYILKDLIGFLKQGQKKKKNNH